MGWNFSENIVIFEISTVDLVKLPISLKKNKMPKFGTKKGLFGYFPARILKIYYRIWYQDLKFVKVQNFVQRNMVNLGPKLPYLGFFGYFFQKLLLSFKSAPSILSNSKNFVKKQNCQALVPKRHYLGIFGLEF